MKTGILRHRGLVVFVLLAVVSLNCTLAQPVIDRLQAARGSLASNEAEAKVTDTGQVRPTPRPTFTSTPAYTATPTATSTPTITPIPSDTPTPVATNTPLPTDTPVPTDTPRPANTRPPQPPTETFTPEPPPTPDFPYAVAEQGVREFQKTSNTTIVIFVAAVDANNTPIGGLKVVGVNASTGEQKESAPSSWQYDAVNCLDCGYIKQGNVKFEPGPFTDTTWNVYLADGGGTQLSPMVPLSYSSSPETWVWDFIIFRKK